MPTHTSHPSSLTLVIDQGSHASRIALFTETGDLHYLKSKNISTNSLEHPTQQNQYEQNANEILLSIQTLLNELPIGLRNNIKCCGLCTQRSTIVAWHRTTGEALSPSISWRDTRAQPLMDKLSAFASKIRKISGLPLSAHYSAGKIHWLLENNTTVKEATKNKQLCISPIASFLMFHLLNEKPQIIDHSNAQRCQLFNTQTLDWSNDLLQWFKIEKEVLPKCAPVIHPYGTLTLNNIPLTCVCGDQNAVLYAYPPLQKNNALINIGTGAFILSASEERKNKEPRLLRTIASSNAQNAVFVTEGTVNGAGASLSWAQENDPCDDIFSKLPIWLKQVTSPPVFINNISNLGSPWWCNAGDPEFIGKHAHRQPDRYVAIIESIVFLIFNNIQHLDTSPDTLFISGGLSKLDTLCQKLSDLSKTRVVRYTNTEATARGCAWLSNQSLQNNNLNWKILEISQQFYASKYLNEHLQLKNRYQQFVGELNKRCNND